LSTVAFDVIGTLFTLERPRDRLVSLGAPPHALDLWFAQALRDAFALSHAGDYRPFKDVLEASLSRLLQSLGMNHQPDRLGEVMATFGELDARTDAAEACETLARSGWQIIALTNGAEESTRRLLKHGGLFGYFQELLSCDRIRKTKPHPDVYAMARAREDGELWLVAAHAWDVVGAALAGLKTAWVPSVEATYLSIYPEPVVTAPDLSTAASLIVEGSAGPGTG
jgi:2-haloacid dehalogenase